MYKDPFASSRNNNPSRMGGMRANSIKRPAAIRPASAKRTAKPASGNPLFGMVGGSGANLTFDMYDRNNGNTSQVPYGQVDMSPVPQSYGEPGQRPMYFPSFGGIPTDLGGITSQSVPTQMPSSRTQLIPQKPLSIQPPIPRREAAGSPTTSTAQADQVPVQRPRSAVPSPMTTPLSRRDMQAEIDQRVIDMGPEYGYDASPVEGPYADDLSIEQRVWLNAREEGRRQRAEAHDKRMAELRQRTHSIRPGWDYDMANTPRANRPQTISGTSAPDMQDSYSFGQQVSRPLVGYSDTGIANGLVSPIYGMTDAQKEQEREYMKMLNAKRPSRFPTMQSGPASDLAGAIQSGGYGGDYSAVNDMLPVPMQHTEVSANLTPEQRAAMNERRAARMNRGRDFITQNAQDQAIGRKQRLEQRKWNQVPRPMTLEQQLMASGDPRSALMFRDQNLRSEAAAAENRIRQRQLQLEQQGMSSMEALRTAQAEQARSEADLNRRAVEDMGSPQYKIKQEIDRLAAIPPELMTEDDRIRYRDLQRQYKDMLVDGEGPSGNQDGGGDERPLTTEQVAARLQENTAANSRMASKFGLPTTPSGGVDISGMSGDELTATIASYKSAQQPTDYELENLVSMLDGQEVSQGNFENGWTFANRQLLPLSAAAVDQDGREVPMDERKQRLGAALKFLRIYNNKGFNFTEMPGWVEEQLPVVNGYKLNRHHSRHMGGRMNRYYYTWDKVDE